MPSVVVELDAQSIERVSADLVVVGVSPDDRPLRGAASRADWRFCGELWQLVSARKLRGLLGEAALLSASGPMRSPLLLIVGLGHRAELSAATWRVLGGGIARRALDLQLQRVALGLASDAADLGPDGTRALFAGAAVATADRSAEIQLVIAGDAASARLAELRSLAEVGLPDGASLKLPSATGRSAKSAPTPVGVFPHSEDVRFK